MNCWQQLSPTEGIWVLRDLWTAAETAKWFGMLKEQLHPLLATNERQVVLNGPNVKEPRDVFYQSLEKVANLKYAAVNYPPTPMISSVHSILNQLKKHFQLQPNIQQFEWAKLSTKLNCVLINVYPKETDRMGAHADNNDYIDCNKLIVSISFGATRTFQLLENHKRTEGTCKVLFETLVNSGDIIIMYGESVQRTFKHAVPRGTAGLRINLSFRCHKSK